MKQIFNFLVRQDKFAFLLTLMVLLLGGAASIQIQRDMFPKVDFGVVRINTAYPGASSSDVELQITDKIEDAIKDISGIDRFRSESLEGFSKINIVLKSDISNQDEVKTSIRDAVNRIDDFPESLSKLPVISVRSADSYPLLELGLSGPYSYEYIRNVAKRLGDELDDIEGVSAVQKFGYREPAVYLNVKPEAMKRYQISLFEITSAIRAQYLRDSGGNIELNGSEKQLVNHIVFNNIEEINDIILKTSFQGNAIRVSDVASVSRTFKDASIKVRMNGDPGIAFKVYRSGSSDILDVASDVKETLKRFEENEVKKVNIAFSKDYSYYVKNRLSIVITNGAIGLLLVLILISFFLGFRISLWVALGIPVSIFGVLFVMYMSGRSLDILSMAAFIIVIGIIVDDAIIVSESIVNEREQGLSPVDAAASGVSKVFKPVLATILTTFVAFCPLMLMPGVVGKFVMVIPLVITISLIFSLIEVVLALPAHMVKGLKKISRRAENNHSLFFKFKEKFQIFVFKSLRWRYILLLSFLTVFVSSVYFAATRMDFILFPSDTAEQIDVNVTLSVGTLLEDTALKLKEIESIIAKFDKDEVKAFVTMAGVSWDAEDESMSSNHHKALISIYLTSFSSRERNALLIKNELKEKFDQLKGFESIQMNVEGGGPPVGAPISLEVISDNDDERTRICDWIEDKLLSYGSVSDIRRNDTLQKDEYRLKVNQELVSRLKLSTQSILFTLRTAFNGETVAEISENNETTSYIVRLQDEARKSLSALTSLFVLNQQGRYIPISQVAIYEATQGSPNRFHFDGERSVTIKANVDKLETTVNAIVARLQQDLDSLELAGVKVRFGGEAEEFSKSFESLKISFIVALIGMYLILMVLFNSFWQPFIALSAVPFAIFGVIVAFSLHDQAFTFLSLLGIVGLTGVVVNDSLVMVCRINDLRREHSKFDMATLVSRGAADRLRAILITTLTTVLGVLPLSYGWGGLDPFIAPMGLALGFGLLFSTPLILLLLPSIYMIVQDVKHLFVKRSS